MGHVGQTARCVLDVSAAVEAVNKMTLVIVKAVDKCGAITTENPQCGLAAGTLTSSVAALSKASAGIVAKCPNDYNHGTPLATVGGAMNAAATANDASDTATAMGGGFNPTFGQCIINIKDSVKSLFKAVKRAMILSDACTEPESLECAHNAIKLVDAFVGLAEFVSGAVGKCAVAPNNRVNGQCAAQSLALVRAVGTVDRAGTALAAACAPTPAARLYLDSLDQKKVAAAPASSGLTMGLTAMLPLTAVVAFVAGKRLATARSVQPLPDEEMLVQVE